MSQLCSRCSRSLDLPVPVAFCPYCGQALGVTVALDPGQTTAPATSHVREVPEQLGDYRLLRQLGEGGMGVVFEGEHLPTGRRVAVELVDVEASDDALTRFRQEGKLASAVSHPRCVFVFAVDEDAGRPFIVLELMPGKTLDDEVRQRGPLGVGEAIGHAIDLVEGLEQVHALGVIHRDVKPSNCFLDTSGRVKVGDFGLARSLEPDAKLTRTGTFVGTPLYAPPEQIKAQQLDARADVYSVCATLFFLLTGRAPNDRGDGDSMAVMARVVSEDPPPIRSLRPEVPIGLDRLLARGLSRDRERRQPDLATLRTELSAFRQTMPGARFVGARIAAYFVDALLHTPMVWGVSWLRGQKAFVDHPDAFNTLSVWLLTVSYYVLLEGLFGCGLGKWLFGLRVCRAGDVGPPGLGRALWRTLCWSGATSMPSVVLLVVWPPTPQNIAAIGLFQSVFGIVGVGLMACRMQKANGYSGLHDLWTNTRVVPLPQPETAVRYPSKPVPSVTASAGGAVGPYRVLGEAWAGDGERVLLAMDPSLDRAVWVWLRPLDRPAIGAARRDEPSAARPRWLANGDHDAMRWDAFLVPPGSPLPDAVGAAGRRTWEQARAVLLDLSAELGRADEAENYTLSQVWLTPEGRVLLIDVPLGAAPFPGRADVLASAAVALLEGKPPSPKRTRPPRGIMPKHAREVVCGLPTFGGTLDVTEFHERLTQTKDRPTHVSRQVRLLHLSILLAVQTMCCGGMGVFLALSMGMFATGRMDAEATYNGQRRLKTRDRDAAILAAPLVAPTTQPLNRLASALLLTDHQQPRAMLADAIDRLEAARDARMARLATPVRMGIEQGKASARPPEPSAPRISFFLWELEKSQTIQAAIELDRTPRSAHFFFPGLWLMLLPVGVCVMSVMTCPQGFRSLVLGIDVVRGDGAPAGRLRCIWRTLMAWTPPLALIVLARWGEEEYWDGWTPERSPWLLALVDVGWAAAAVGICALALWIVWTPARSLHDRLAGTWLVPR